MADQRLRELLIRAELEDCKILEKDESPYLAFFGVVGILAEAAAAEPEFVASTITARGVHHNEIGPESTVEGAQRHSGSSEAVMLGGTPPDRHGLLGGPRLAVGSCAPAG